MDDARGTILLLLDLPPAAFCGIDLLSFTASDRFRGIKHLPSGLHFIFTSATNSFSLRHGAWFRVPPPQPNSPPHLIIEKWDAGREELIAGHDAVELLRWRANLGAIWRDGLTPYRQSAGGGSSAEAQDEAHEERQDWTALTDCVTERLLARITGVSTPGANHFPLTSASSARQDEDIIPGLSASEQAAFGAERELRFLPIDLKRTWREGAVGRERTDAAQDFSYALETLVREGCAGDVGEVLGELQFCFVALLTLNNHSALMQWRRLLTLVLTCRAAVVRRAGFFVRFLVALRLQLERAEDAEGGLFDMSEEGGTLLRGLLRKFRQGLERLEGDGKVDVEEELDGLEEWLNEKHGWRMNQTVVRRGMLDLEDGERVEVDMGAGEDEDEEDGEYAPTVVELTEEQMESLPGEFKAATMARRGKSALHRLDEEADSHGADDEVQDVAEEEEQNLEDMDMRY